MTKQEFAALLADSKDQFFEFAEADEEAINAFCDLLEENYQQEDSWDVTL